MPFPLTGALVSPSHCPSSSAVVSKLPFFQIMREQNREKLSKIRYFDCLDVVNWPPTHSEFSLGRPVFGCGNWWKLYHEFEKYVAGFAITWFKLVAYNGCKRTGCFHYLNWKAELFHVIWCHEFNGTFNLLTRNGCVYKVFQLLLIESCLFLEVSKKFQKTTARLWITSLHVMQRIDQIFFFSRINHVQMTDNFIYIRCIA